MAVLLGTTNNKEELIISCECGCDEGIRIKIDKEDYDYFAVMTYISGNWYREQNGVLRCFVEKIKKIWRIIRSKDYYYSEIIMTRDDFQKFKKYVDQFGE